MFRGNKKEKQGLKKKKAVIAPASCFFLMDQVKYTSKNSGILPQRYFRCLRLNPKAALMAEEDTFFHGFFSASARPRAQPPPICRAQGLLRAGVAGAAPSHCRERLQDQPWSPRSPGSRDATSTSAAAPRGSIDYGSSHWQSVYHMGTYSKWVTILQIALQLCETVLFEQPVPLNTGCVREINLGSHSGPFPTSLVKPCLHRTTAAFSGNKAAGLLRSSSALSNPPVAAGVFVQWRAFLWEKNSVSWESKVRFFSQISGARNPTHSTLC